MLLPFKILEIKPVINTPGFSVIGGFVHKRWGIGCDFV